MTSDDSDFPTKTRKSGEDPLGFFLSEDEPKSATVRPPRVGRAVARWFAAMPRPTWRRPAMRVPTWRLPVMRLPAWRLPGVRLPAVHLPEWHRPSWRVPAWPARVASIASQAGAAATQMVARAPVSTVAVGAFACGIIVGGSAVWLSGASRRVGFESGAPQQVQVVSRPVVIPFAPGYTPPSGPRVEQRALETRTATATPSAKPRRPVFRGSLVVNSRPSGARVFLNGRSVGKTPLVLKNEPAGSRAVRVALDGYEAWWSAVQVVANSETRLRAELRAQQPPAQP
jgi:PEGA domain